MNNSLTSLEMALSDVDTSDFSTKQCTKCKAVKLLSSFRHNRGTRDGLHCWCKECEKLYKQNWHSKHKETIHVCQRKWRRKHREFLRGYHRKYNKIHKKHLQERAKKYRVTHMEARRERDKHRRAKNRKQYLAYQRKWYKKNIVIMHEHTAIRLRIPKK